MGVALMADIEDQLIGFEIENAVKGDGQFDVPKV